MDPLHHALHMLARGQHLAADEAAAAVAEIMAGEAPEARVAAFLMGLRVKGETEEELLGCARAMRAAAVRIAPRREPLVDTCGTGGDGANTFNISTVSALVAAASGAAVAKHGNRSVSSRCGSADLLEALGVHLLADPAGVERCIEELGFGFMFAPHFHPAMRHVAPVRRTLGLRTVFNLLGPLTNPAAAHGQVIGVFDARWCTPVARVAGLLGVERCLVVHGHGGVDELTLSGPAHAVYYHQGAFTDLVVDPAGLGLEPAPLEALAGGDAPCNADIARAVLQGREGAPRRAVLLNAAAALLVGGLVEDLAEGVDRCRRTLDSGAGHDLLDALAGWTARAAA